MADVQCPNTDCPEQGITKGNADNYPVEDIRCGACGGPVEAVEVPPDGGGET